MRPCRAIIRLKPYFRKEAFAEAFAGELVRHARAIVRGGVGGHAIVRGGGGGHGVQIDTVGFTLMRLPMRAGSHGAGHSRGEQRGTQHAASISWSGGCGGAPRRAKHHWYNAPAGCPAEVCVEKPTFRGVKKGPPFKSDFGIRNRRDFEKESLSKISEEIFGKFGRGGPGRFSSKSVGFCSPTFTDGFSYGKIQTVWFLGLVACHHVCLVRNHMCCLIRAVFGVAERCAVVRCRAVC